MNTVKSLKDFQVKSLSEKHKVVETIKQYGICKINNFLSGQILDDLTKEVKDVLEKPSELAYAFGKVQILRKANCYSPVINKVFLSKEMLEVAQDYMGCPNLNYEVFVTHDYRHDNGLARNGYLHFDRAFTFKFLIYLSDVDENCGPFSIVPRSHFKGKKLREKTANDQYEDKKNRIFLDYPELGYTEEDIVPVLGEAGDLIIFDTDVFHMGGVVKEGFERLLIRGHTR